MGIEHPAAMTWGYFWGYFLGKSFQKVSETGHFSDQYGFHYLRQLASPLSFANSRRHSFLSGKSRYFNAFTSVLRSACDRRGSSTAGTGGWVRGWVEWFSFDFCLPGNRTRDTEDLPTLGTESRQHQNLRHACGWWWLVFASQQYRRSIVDLPLQTKRP